MKISTCMHCKKVLAECDTIWAAGPLFCSKECGVKWAEGLYDPLEDNITSPDDLTEKATAYFEDIAEEIDVETIGVREEFTTAYSESSDITTIFMHTFENDDELFMEVVGWYFGKPDHEGTLQYINNLRATFYRCEDIEY